MIKLSPLAFAMSAIGKKTSVIPVGKDKRPLIDWKEYQTRIATKEEVEKWWTTWPEANVGIVTGKISNLTVVDVEEGGDISQFPSTLTIQTGGNGWHLYYRYFPIQNKARIFPLTDIRGDGGYVVSPPSVHASGNEYKVISKVPISIFPSHLFGEKKPSEWKEKIISPLYEGSRNNDFASIIGGLLRGFTQDDWEKLVWPLVQDKNKLQESPLNERELRTTFESICRKESQNRHAGGDIKDIYSEVINNEIRITIRLDRNAISFKVKNIVSSLLEAKVITWIERPSGFSHELPFFLKIKSDSNKEQWARILSKAFDKKEEKETYPWTIIITKVVDIVEKYIREHKQDFAASEAVAKQAVWLTEPFIQEDQINTFFGLGSSGKTLMSLYFAVSLAKGGTKSLFIDYENDISSWKDKIQKIDANHNDNLVYYDPEQIPITDQVDKIRELIKARGIRLVIVDSASMATGDSTSDEESVIRLMAGLKLLKTTVLLIAHQRKNDGDKTPIGSIQFENQARNVWNFKKEVDDFDYRVLHIACSHTKANNTYLRRDPICYKIDYQETGITIETEQPEVAFEEKMSVSGRIRKLLKNQPGLSYEDIAEELDISRSTTGKNLTRGKDRGFFKNDDGLWSLDSNGL